MAKKILKVIHVELNEEFNGQKHYYFGSKKAVTDYLGREVVGVAENTLKRIDLSKADYENKKCVIKQGELITCRNKL